jgi:hypothetical protein
VRKRKKRRDKPCRLPGRHKGFDGTPFMESMKRKRERRRKKSEKRKVQENREKK